MPAKIETTSEIMEFFEEIIDDSVDDDLKLSLVNTAKDGIETERDWEMLKTVNETGQVKSGENQDTVRSLPTDILTPLNIYIGDGTSPYIPVPIEHKRRYRELSNCYAIDWKNQKFYILDTFGSTQTIYFNYIYQTPTLSDSENPIWPIPFRKLIAFRMAEVYLGGIDSDEYNARVSLVHRNEADTIFKNMKFWDAKLKTRASEALTIYNQGPSSGRILRD
jgi:hypothetical protein